MRKNTAWCTVYGMFEYLNTFISRLELPVWLHNIVDPGARLLTLLVAVVIIRFLVKKLVVANLERLIKKSRSRLDDFFVSRAVFKRLTHLGPALTIYAFSFILFSAYPGLQSALNLFSVVYFILVIFWSFQAVLGALEDIYNTRPYAAERPIRIYMQLLSLLSYIICFFILLSLVFDIQITRVFAGLGAMAAVLMLVFKDTILGFVAGIQLSANRMVRVGDWIEMPSHNADGDVLEITLNTVKVQNWDRTITTIPTYELVSRPFMNWRGMTESGGRRIKRSVNLDMKSVQFCTPEMLEKYKKIHHLKDYIEEREKEIIEYNKANSIDESVPVNGRHMTNIGVFRKYLENYIRRHPKINQDMIFIVRQLQSSEKGLPIEIYAFSREQSWVRFEEVQSDIFDHVLAVIPEFSLRVFQLPGGDDIQSLGGLFKAEKLS